MILTEYNEKLREKTLREEGWENGLAQGLEQGLEQGRSAMAASESHVKHESVR